VKPTALALVSLAILALVPACPGGGEDCGPGDAAGDGLVIGNGADVTLRYHMLAAHANNDCPDPAAPQGVISLTIDGQHVQTGESITLCVPRPDLLEDGGALGTAVQLIDVNGAQNECTYIRNTTTPATGTVRGEGVCDAGNDPAGFALVFDGMVTLDRTCLAGTETVTLAMTGAVSVIAD
jgi:hypothetical protein